MRRCRILGGDSIAGAGHRACFEELRRALAANQIDR